MRALDLQGGAEILSVADSIELLRTHDVGRVGVVVDGVAEIFPVNYWWDGDRICFRTNDGRKVHGLRVGVGAFEVDDISRRAHAGWSVMVRGEADIVAVTDGEPPEGKGPWTGDKSFEVHIRPRVVTGRRVG